MVLVHLDTTLPQFTYHHHEPLPLLDIVTARNLKTVNSDNTGVHAELWNREIARALSIPLPSNWENTGGPVQLFRKDL